MDCLHTNGALIGSESLECCKLHILSNISQHLEPRASQHLGVLQLGCHSNDTLQIVAYYLVTLALW